jgi:hypothetical protein
MWTRSQASYQEPDLVQDMTPDCIPDLVPDLVPGLVSALALVLAGALVQVLPITKQNRHRHIYIYTYIHTCVESYQPLLKLYQLMAVSHEFRCVCDLVNEVGKAIMQPMNWPLWIHMNSSRHLGPMNPCTWALRYGQQTSAGTLVAENGTPYTPRVN